MATQKLPQKNAAFFDILKQALESINQPEWLGIHSPLAAPYFLGAALAGMEPTPMGRGQALCAEIERTVAPLWGGPLPESRPEFLAGALAEGGQGGRYDCLILELNYFKQRYRPAPRSQADVYNDILHISRPTHDRHLRSAVERLAGLFLRRLRPAIRPEQPILPTFLIGRDHLLAQAQDALAAGRTVSLTGPGGVGKSSLAAALADDWPSPAIFWYTLRPTFNDQLESLLFALGHFLDQQGAATLWHQLVADGGRIKDLNLALGLVRSGLASLGHKPLLCIDELDFLRPLVQGEEKPSHRQLLEFLDSLRGYTAMLLIGQRAYWESDTLLALEGLRVAEISRLLSHLAVVHTPEDAAALHVYSGGNPRLVELCVALYQTGATGNIAGVLQQIPHFHGLLPLWLRLERRLPAGEREVLRSLAVFRSPAPADVWQRGGEEVAEALARLLDRRLIQEDDQGGVTLLPALREIVYTELPVEEREDLHAQAAQVRAERGEYTAGEHFIILPGQKRAMFHGMR